MCRKDSRALAWFSFPFVSRFFCLSFGTLRTQKTYRQKRQIRSAGFSPLPRSAYWGRPWYLKWMEGRFEIPPIAGFQTGTDTPPDVSRLRGVDPYGIEVVFFSAPWGDQELKSFVDEKLDLPRLRLIVLEGSGYSDASLQTLVSFYGKKRFKLDLRDTTQISPEGVREVMVTGRVKGVYLVGCPQLSPAASAIFEHCVGEDESSFGHIDLRGVTLSEKSLQSAAGKTFDIVKLTDTHAVPDWFSEINCRMLAIDGRFVVRDWNIVPRRVPHQIFSPR